LLWTGCLIPDCEKGEKILTTTEGKYLLITGVSTGIGYAAAADLAGAGYHVFGSVRSQADADRLRQEIPANFTPLVFDVTDQVGVETAVTTIAQTIQPHGLTALINNAGISTPGPLQHMPLDQFRYQFEVNLFGLLHVTQQCLPLLGAKPESGQPPGRIINISSVSGRIAYPFMGAYAASKHALEAMSDSLRRELLILGYGIEVILIEPGTVQTPIVGKFGEQIAQYLDTGYGAILQKVAQEAAEREEKALPVTAVTDIIREALESKRPRTRYPIPRKWLSGWLLPRWLPDRWFDRLVVRKLEE
jgi:NAD(P)-dependent dehydrogenase (short-subunit alcohol dehydrogenase family)